MSEQTKIMIIYGDNVHYLAPLVVISDPSVHLSEGKESVKSDVAINGSLAMNPAEVVLLGLKHSPNSVGLKPLS